MLFQPKNFGQIIIGHLLGLPQENELSIPQQDDLGTQGSRRQVSFLLATLGLLLIRLDGSETQS